MQRSQLIFPFLLLLIFVLIAYLLSVRSWYAYLGMCALYIALLEVYWYARKAMKASTEKPPVL